MASSIMSIFEKPDFLRIAGVVAVSYVAFKLALSLLKGFWTYGLGKVLGAGKNLKRYGEWAGELIKVHVTAG